MNRLQSGMQKLRAWFRLFLFAITISIAIFFCMVSALFGGDKLRRNMGIRRRWILIVSKLIGLKVLHEGAIPEGTYLFVSNHKSFMDPVVALHFLTALPLAKAEVDDYPLIGYGVRMSGVLFVKRESLRSRANARRAIEDSLTQDRSVLIYPEGTTNNQLLTTPFKAGSFGVVAEREIGVIPIAIEYLDPKDHWKDRSLLKQYLYQFGKRSSTCRIGFGPIIVDNDSDRLKEKTQSWIDAKLVSYREAFDR